MGQTYFLIFRHIWVEENIQGENWSKRYFQWDNYLNKYPLSFIPLTIEYTQQNLFAFFNGS